MRGFAGAAAGLVLAMGAGAAAAQTLETVGTTPAEPFLIESVAPDAGGALILSSVNRGHLYRVGADGGLASVAEDAVLGFYGLAADPERGLLYAVAAVRPGGDAALADTALLKIDAGTGAVMGRTAVPAGAHRFGDVAVGPDGTAYVADATALRLWAWRSDGTLAPLADLPDGASPQGMAVSADGRWLVFADYRSGLHRVDLVAAREAPIAFAADSFAPLPAPEGAELRGLDGLVRHGDTIIAIQNGTQTPRVLRLTLNADWSAVTAREALAEGAPLSEPTTGFVEGDDLVFVSRSQWTDFGRDGRPISDSPAPAVISRLSIPVAEHQQ